MGAYHPQSRDGPDVIDNMVQACRECNVKKGDKGPFEWYGLERRYEIPRIVLGKYLKLAYEHHECANDLDSLDLNADGKLDVYNLDAIFRKSPSKAAGFYTTPADCINRR